MRSAYENIELIRSARGVTKTKLARDAQMSDMNMHRILTGKTRMPADLVPVMATSLAIEDINVFFDDKLTDSVIGKS